MKLMYIVLIVGIGIGGAVVMLVGLISLIGISFRPFTKAEQKCNQYVAFACETKNRLPEEQVTQKPTSSDTIKAVWHGNVVHRGHLPHMVFIHTTISKTICGGSLISENFFITAKHCGEKIQVEGAKILIGVVILEEDKSSQTFSSSEVYFYPGPSGTMKDDICLVKLNASVTFTAYIRPICLNIDQNVQSNQLTASGWGKHEGNFFSRELKEVKLESLPESFCNASFPQTYNSTTFICAGSQNVYADACEGDSGGPLQMPHKTSPCPHVYHLVGVVSRGAPCQPGPSKAYGIYAKVAFYIPWIEKTVWP